MTQSPNPTRYEKGSVAGLQQLTRAEQGTQNLFNCNILYCTALFCTTLYYIVLYWNVILYIVLHYDELYFLVFYCSAESLSQRRRNSIFSGRWDDGVRHCDRRVKEYYSRKLELPCSIRLLASKLCQTIWNLKSSHQNIKLIFSPMLILHFCVSRATVWMSK